MYQFEICLIIFAIIILLLCIIAYYCKKQADLTVQGKNKPKRIYVDEYYYMLRNRFPKAKELYEYTIIDEINEDGLAALVSANILKRKENIYGEPIYEFYFEREM